MENGNVDKLARMVMAYSNLEITDPLFNEIVMKQVLLEYHKQKNLKPLSVSILVFAGIELILTALVWMLLTYYPGYEYFGTIISNIIPLLGRIGEIAIKNEYLILSFGTAYLVHWILNLKVKETSII